jgi:pSer/pThr/pTyr-binding forkhead associated (FHA) protein
MDTSVSKLLEDSVPAQGPRGSRLIIMNGPEDGRVFVFSKSPVGIGRQDSNDVPILLDPSVSRKHARVVREGAECFIEDLNSAYGTYVDDQRITGRRGLSDSSMIRIGETELAFRMGGEKKE